MAYEGFEAIREEEVILSEVPLKISEPTYDRCQCQNRRISCRGSRTVHLRLMVTGGGGHGVYPGSTLSMEVIPYFLLD